MCDRIRTAFDVVAIVCGRRNCARKHCRVCGEHASRLCDAAIADGDTCDAPLCVRHANTIGRNRHLCPRHAVERVRAAITRAALREVMA
jgi:hypothetical protein